MWLLMERRSRRSTDTYISAMVTKDHGQVQEMKRRIGQGWSAFYERDNIMGDKNVPMRLKRKAFNECILPVMTYGSENWSLSNTQLEKLITTQRKMERIMAGVTLKDRKNTNWIRKKSDGIGVIRNIWKSKHRWAGLWLGSMTTDGQSESQNRYPVGIKDFASHQERSADDLIRYVGPTWSRTAKW